MKERLVTSGDGTRLWSVREGAGASVVLVHGTMGGVGDWLPTLPRLSPAFEVTAFDRRGRGGSGDGPDYSIDREIEDVLAVIDASGPPVHLVGHSFGAVLAVLVAAGAPDRIGKLVLYEPPIGAADPSGDVALDALDAAVAAGDLDAAVGHFAAMAGTTAEDLRGVRRNDRARADLRDGVRTAAREIRAAREVLPFNDDVVRAVSADTLVLVGSEQDNPTYAGVRDLADRLPSGTLGEVPGRHLAPVFAPDAFAATVGAFLAGP